MTDIVERLRGYYERRELPTWGELLEAADVIGRYRVLYPERDVLKASDMDTCGNLFGIRFTDGCSNGCAELYVEDDENYHYQLNFDRVWLADLEAVVVRARATLTAGHST